MTPPRLLHHRVSPPSRPPPRSRLVSQESGSCCRYHEPPHSPGSEAWASFLPKHMFAGYSLCAGNRTLTKGVTLPREGPDGGRFWATVLFRSPHTTHQEGCPVPLCSANATPLKNSPHRMQKSQHRLPSCALQGAVEHSRKGGNGIDPSLCHQHCL